MELDLTTLAQLHEMAHQGAEEAAERLTEFTGVETELGITKINFVTPREMRNKFSMDVNHVSVSQELDGGTGGHSVVVFDEKSAQNLTDALFATVGDDIESEFANGEELALENISLETEKTKHLPESLRQSGLRELSNILGCAFVDGWADKLHTNIDVSPPTLRGGKTTEEVFGRLERVGENTEIAIMFETDIRVIDTEIKFAHFLFPNINQLEESLTGGRTGDVEGFNFEKLVGFDAMVEEGAARASQSMSKLTGVETEVDIRHLNFVRIDQLSQSLPNEERIGIAFEYNGLPSGYLLFLFSEESARDLVRELPTSEPEDPLGEEGRSALQEIGNILSSRIIDGWANVLNTSVDHTPPEYVHDVAPAIIDPIVATVGREQEYAFSFDTRIVADDKEFDCEIYSICDHGDLETALSQLKLEDLHQAHETPSFPLKGVKKDPESIETEI